MYNVHCTPFTPSVYINVLYTNYYIYLNSHILNHIYIYISFVESKKTTTVRLYESFHAIFHAIISSQCKLRMKGVRIV